MNRLFTVVLLVALMAATGMGFGQAPGGAQAQPAGNATPEAGAAHKAQAGSAPIDAAKSAVVSVIACDSSGNEIARGKGFFIADKQLIASRHILAGGRPRPGEVRRKHICDNGCRVRGQARRHCPSDSRRA